VIPLHVPPLRDRKDDIPLLVDTFLEKLSQQTSEPRKKITTAALDLLVQYEWQGNVRELKNIVERLSIMVSSDTIHEEDIPSPYNPKCLPSQVTDDTFLNSDDSLADAKKRFEREYIRKQLDRDGGDIKAAAKALGTTESYIKKALKQ
jgi:two-component system nitrogen regulation response regulator NtrX